MQLTARSSKIMVSADGTGIVSQGSGLVWPDGLDLAPEPLYEQARAHPLVAA